MNILKRIRQFLSLRKKTFTFIYILLAVLLLMTVLKVHGSSIGVWNKYIDDNIYKEGLVLGVPRTIRSDEWLVQTPLALSQNYNDYEQYNKFVGNGQDTAVLYDAPNKHWSTIFKPHNWGFFVLPEENAYAFKWWSRGLLLVFSTYVLLLAITKRNYLLSILGSLLMFFTPMVQWWYAIQVMEPISYGFLALYCAIRILHYENKKRLFLYISVLTFSLIAFSIAFYPAFQVPVMHVVIACFIGYLLQNWNEIKKSLPTKIFTLSTSLLIAIAVLTSYFFSVRDTIDSILSTSYPGARFINGGGYTLIQFLSGPYSFFLQLNSVNIPAIFGNQSEASNFITILPFIIIFPYIIYLLIKNRNNNLNKLLYIIPLLLLFITNILFVFFGFNNFIAKYSLFYLIPENRLMIGIGLISFLGLILFTNSLQKKEIIISERSIAIIFAIITTIIVAFIGRELFLLAPNYMQSKWSILIVSFSFGLMIFLLLSQKTKIFISFLLLISALSTGFVNPIYYGLKPLRDSEFSQELVDLNNKYNKEGKKWVVFDSMIWGNYLIAQGIPTLNGTHLYPQLEIWSEYDPDGKYIQNYNRYSHIVFIAIDTDDVIFSNPVPDTLEVRINPCNSVIQKVSKILITEKDMYQYECMKRINTIDNLYVYIYI